MIVHTLLGPKLYVNWCSDTVTMINNYNNMWKLQWKKEPVFTILFLRCSLLSNYFLGMLTFATGKKKTDWNISLLFLLLICPFSAVRYMINSSNRITFFFICSLINFYHNFEKQSLWRMVLMKIVKMGLMKMCQMATLQVRRGEDWHLDFFSRTPMVTKCLDTLCGVPYYT